MENRVITMFYELKDADTGEILEGNIGEEAVKFITGFGQIVEKLEEAVLEMKDGEERTVRVSAAEGVGEYDATAVQSVPKEQFAGIELVEGMELFGEGEDGHTVRVTVKAIGESEVMVDFNHPYAGKTLEFAVKVAENRPATADEIAMGRPEGVHVCECGHDHGHGDHECCGGHGHHHGDHECCGGHGHGDHECCGGHGHDK